MKKLFVSINVVKDHDKEKYVYNGYGIGFDGKRYKYYNIWG